MTDGYEQFRVTGKFPKEAEIGVVKIDTVIPAATREELAWLTFRREGRVKVGEAYTRLLVHGRLVMSDTPDEYTEHWAAINAATGRVLVNGLGLGCYLHAILAKPDVTHVDVVEREPDVARFFRMHHPDGADRRVRIHLADAFEQMRTWPKGTRWDYAWHDIWPEKCEDDLAEHARLLRSYGQRVGAQGCWGHEYLQRLRRSGW